MHRLLLAYYRVLKANRPLPQDLLWSLAHLAELFSGPHPDTGVRLLAILCFALQSGMSEVEKSTLEKQVLGEDCAVDCPVWFGEGADGMVQEIDGWVLPVLEVRRVTEARNALLNLSQDCYTVEEGATGPSLSPSDLR